jgi:hypothetical protein
MASPLPEGLPERLFGLLALVVVISLVVWLNMPKLLWPAFILTLVGISADRWRRGVYPWPPRKSAH